MHLMNYETYAPVLEKAKTRLSQKNTLRLRTSFSEIRVSQKQVEVFRFITKARRKIMRRLGL